MNAIYCMLYIVLLIVFYVSYAIYSILYNVFYIEYLYHGLCEEGVEVLQGRLRVLQGV